MIQTIVSAIAVFVATSIDYLLILTILFSQVQTKKGITHIVGGQYLGTTILVAVSLLAAYVLHFIPEEWMIGFLGLVPIILGIRVAVKGDDDEEDEAGELAEKIEARKSSRLSGPLR